MQTGRGFAFVGSILLPFDSPVALLSGISLLDLFACSAALETSEDSLAIISAIFVASSDYFSSSPLRSLLLTQLGQMNDAWVIENRISIYLGTFEQLK